MSEPKVVYWHRDLPPVAAEPVSEDEVEASGPHHPIGTDEQELWARSREALLATAERRIAQEVTMKGGTFAHVSDDHVEAHSDHTIGESWLRGRYSFVIYR